MVKKSLVPLLQTSYAQANQHDAQYDGPARYQGRVFDKEARTQREQRCNDDDATAFEAE